MSDATLYGLVLAGGHSKRMRRDKAQLHYAGRPQLERALELMRPLTARCFVSVRADQRNDPQRSVHELIADLEPDLGPIGGIDAALRTHPQQAWLVLACDLPFLDEATLRHLIAHRNRTRLATAFRSNFDARPEPLCAIFEPASREPVRAWIERGQTCPRALLAQADVELLDLPHARALDNINTTAEYAAAAAALAETRGEDSSGADQAVRRRVNVRYFALLREQAGRSSEQLQTEARTPQELYAELQSRHGLTLAPQFLRVALNDEFGDWHARLHDGDTVGFLPPVAGG